MTSRLEGGRTWAVLAMAVMLAGSAVGSEAPDAGDSLARLKAGNARFIANPAMALPIDPQHRAEPGQGQMPFATVLTCADGVVPPEVVFNATLGDLVVVRSAGHVPDRAVLASLEHGVEQLHTPLLVVMGHQMCSAVRTAIDGPVGESRGPNLDFLLKALQPALTRSASAPAHQRLRAAILENVEETINDIFEQSPALRRHAEAGTVTLVGAYYEQASGRVVFSEVVQPPVTGTSRGTH